jgi:hypothetical protein
MKISIHGTQGGASTFTEDYLAGVSDPNSDNPSDHSVGTQTYAMNITNNVRIFSKYGIIQDVKGNKRVGYVGFSVGFRHNERLSGVYTKEILDKLAKYFYKEHIDEYNNLDTFQDDLVFVEDVKLEYQSKVSLITDKYPAESFSLGEKDAAYIYYSSKEQLEEFFDFPYLEVYKPFKRVFFIDLKYKNRPENPLRALRHSKDGDLTGLRILENIPYRIGFSPEKNGIRTIVRREGVEVNHETLIQPKDRLEITFSKRNHYDYEKPINGSLDDLKKNHHEHVKVSDNNTRVRIIPPGPGVFDALQKTIEFKVIPSSEDPVIEVKRRGVIGDNKKVYGKKITFKGDELDDEWEVQINGKTEGQTFIPNRQLAGELEIRIKGKSETFNKTRTNTPPVSETSIRKERHETDKKRKNRISKWIMVFIVGIAAVVLAFGIYFSVDYFNSDKGKRTSSVIDKQKVEVGYDEIKAYSEGTELFLDKLKSYSDIASKNAKENQDQEYNWATISESLKEKQGIREAINKGEIQQLRDRSDSYKYSRQQSKFKEAVLAIDTLYIIPIGHAMNGSNDRLSEMNLEQIADFLTSYQMVLKIEKEVDRNADQDSLKQKRDELDKLLPLEPEAKLPSANQKAEDLLATLHEWTSKPDSDQSIASGVDERTLSEATENSNSKENRADGRGTTSSKNDNRQKEFEKKFWNLINKAEKKKVTYDDLVREYNDISSQNEVKAFYDEHLSKSNDFKEFKKIKDIRLKQASKVEDLKVLIKD